MSRRVRSVVLGGWFTPRDQRGVYVHVDDLIAGLESDTDPASAAYGRHLAGELRRLRDNDLTDLRDGT